MSMLRFRSGRLLQEAPLAPERRFLAVGGPAAAARACGACGGALGAAAHFACVRADTGVQVRACARCHSAHEAARHTHVDSNERERAAPTGEGPTSADGGVYGVVKAEDVMASIDEALGRPAEAGGEYGRAPAPIGPRRTEASESGGYGHVPAPIGSSTAASESGGYGRVPAPVGSSTEASARSQGGGYGSTPAPILSRTLGSPYTSTSTAEARTYGTVGDMASVDKVLGRQTDVSYVRPPQKIAQ